MEQQKSTNPEDKNWVYLLESDLGFVAKVNRITQTMAFIVLASLLTIIYFAWRVDPPDGLRPPLILLAAAWIAAMWIASLAFRARGPMEGCEAWVGADFLAASNPAIGRRMAIVRFQDIVAVTIGLSKGRIVEVVVRAKKLTWVCMRHVKDPAVAVRAIFESGPAHVKWRRRGRPFTRLTRDEVAALIKEADVPPMNEMLPPGATWGRIEEMFVRDAKGRLSAGGSVRSVNMVARKPPATEAR